MWEKGIHPFAYYLSIYNPYLPFIDNKYKEEKEDT